LRENSVGSLLFEGRRENFEGFEKKIGETGLEKRICGSFFWLKFPLFLDIEKGNWFYSIWWRKMKLVLLNRVELL
jgi:hypothetical protein